MMNKDDIYINRFRQALTLPIRSRCAELTVLFDRGGILDLNYVYPLLIDDIFGPQGSLSWGLRAPRDVNDDFRQLTHFLSPCGPVFKLIYTLLKYPAKFDFSIVHLPLKVQQILENPQLHPFYADLVHLNPQTKRTIALSLNPFDYYMFHFAYHLINPWHQRTGVALPNTIPVQISWNTVYYVLCCDYILHFLPTNPGNSVLPVVSYNGKKSPVHSLQQINPSSSGSRLINASVLNKSVEEVTFSSNFGRHPRSQIWRSETVLTVFIDMWFNNDNITHPTNQINRSFNASQMPTIIQYNELPSAEYMRIVRVLIKQIHSFSASAKIDDTYMSELKKISLPMVSNKFYIFLRNLIHRWPLDGSFRLLLELWLTYIQPWRYLSELNAIETKKQNLDTEDNLATPASVDRSFLPFIAENLLMYVVIFQQLLPRFSRVDLISPKMSVMLFRITKVFSQTHLAAYIKEIELSVENNHSPGHSFTSHWAHTLPPLNPTTNWCSNTHLNNTNLWGSKNDLLNTSRNFNFSSNSKATFMNSLSGDQKWSVIIKQRMFELEGPAFTYKPLFAVAPAREVFEIFMQIKKSIKVAEELVEIKRQEEEASTSFLSFFKFFWETPKPMDEFSLNERLKVPEYLERSLENMKQIFQVSDVPDSDPDMSANCTLLSNDFEMANDSTFLTPEKVRERIKKIKYDGDPDLHPIRSTEIAFLIRMLYQLSLYINENFRQKFCYWYYDPSYKGRFSRQVLFPPLTVYRYDKTKPGSPRVSSELPPRISLRYFGTYNFWIYLIIGWILAVAFDYSTFVYLVGLFTFVFIYKCIKAIGKSSVRQNYPTEGFRNISFNDSF